MLKITVEELPHGDETAARVVAEGRICNLRQHPPGSPLGDFHAFFETDYTDDDENRHTLVASTYTKDFPRREGTVWDLVATMLNEGGLGRPKEDNDGSKE